PETGAISYTPAPVHRNHLEMTLLVKNGILPLGDALTLLTSNPARNLSLPQKGRIAVGADADLVVLNDDLSIGAVYAMGKKYVG
ncbi:MAG: amidohydrolase family protein, partial [Bacteroidales bacterium]|nr:amidohydrolase family protein [Bacteroidales bacterium]